VDIIDASDFDFLLPRRRMKLVVVALIVGVPFVPPVQRWYLGQIEHHAQHLTREISNIDIAEGAKPAPSGSSGGQSDRH
jgi:hypothetical protein